MGGTPCRAQLGKGAWVLSLPTSSWGLQSPLDHCATQQRISRWRGLRLPSESSVSSYVLSSSCRSKKLDNENGTDCLRDGTAAWGQGMAQRSILKLQVSAQWDILPAQKEVGEGSALRRGIRCTGGFREAAQVELVNYEMPHLRSVI